ncbi:MAG: hypothetical protein ACK47B_23830 [Armatimonadota bacterium]
MFRALGIFVGGLVMEPRQPCLSLGRCSMLAVTAAVVWLTLCHPHVLVTMGWPAACVLSVLFLVLAAYNYGSKPHVKDTILTLAGRVPNAGDVAPAVLGGTPEGGLDEAA